MLKIVTLLVLLSTVIYGCMISSVDTSDRRIIENNNRPNQLMPGEYRGQTAEFILQHKGLADSIE